MSDKQILIIGAGPAGLATAYELEQHHAKTRIIEANNVVGGIARTSVYKGYRADIGGHRFFTKIPYVQQMWEDICGDDLLIRPRLSRIYFQKKFFDYPLKIGNAFRNLGPLESVRIMASYLNVKLRPPQTIESFEDWVSSRFGRRLFEMFFKSYTEKVWGIPTAEISADWAQQRIKNLSLREALRNALARNVPGKNGKVVTSLIEQFHYPRLGPGMMWEICADKLQTAGHSLHYHERVLHLRHENKVIKTVETADAAGQFHHYPVEQVVSSMPLSLLIRCLRPGPPPEVIEAAYSLRYRDFMAVNIILDEPNVFPDNWIYVHDPEVKLGRIQNYKNWSPEMVPDASKTTLGLEYFLFETEDDWRMDDAALLERGAREVEKIGLVDSRKLIDGWVIRVKKAYPIYDENYQRAVKILQDYLATFKNLQTVGRNGLHRYNNQDHSMLAGIYAARNIAAPEKNDVWSVNTDDDYDEEIKPNDPVERDIESLLSPIDPPAFSASLGVTAGLFLFLVTLLTVANGSHLARETLLLLGQFLPGFRVSVFGAFIGFFQLGLVTAVLGMIFIWVRNMSLKYALNRARRRYQHRKEIETVEDI